MAVTAEWTSSQGDQYSTERFCRPLNQREREEKLERGSESGEGKRSTDWALSTSKLSVIFALWFQTAIEAQVLILGVGRLPLIDGWRDNSMLTPSIHRESD